MCIGCSTVNEDVKVERGVAVVRAEDMDEYKCVSLDRAGRTCGNSASTGGFHAVTHADKRDHDAEEPDDWRGLLKCNECGSLHLYLA